MICGLTTCFMLEKLRWFDYGHTMPEAVRAILEEYDNEETAKRQPRERTALVVQGVVALMLVFALAFHLAEVGLIGLAVIILLTAMNGITEEHAIGKSFEEALPLTALRVVFFAVVAVIHDRHLFTPVIDGVLAMETSVQPAMFFLANGLLSMISDNVFVATVYISEVKAAFDSGSMSREHFEHLAFGTEAVPQKPVA